MKKNQCRFRPFVLLMISPALALTLSACASKAETAWEAANEAFSEEDYASAIEEFTTVIENANIEDEGETAYLIDAYYLRGDAYHMLGEEALSEADYEAALSEDLKERDFTVEVTATRCLRRALLTMQKEDYEGALAYIQEGLSCEEKACEQELRYNEIICYDKLGNTQQELSALAEYTQLYPEDADMQKQYTFLQSR